MKKHADVWDSVFRKLFRYLPKTEFFIEAFCIGLGLYIEDVRAEDFSRRVDARLYDFCAEAHAASDRDDTAEGSIRALHASVQHAHIGLDPLLVFKPYVQRIPVTVIKLGIGAALLHHEDIDTQLQDGLELVQGQLFKALHMLFHMDHPFCFLSLCIILNYNRYKV